MVGVHNGRVEDLCRTRQIIRPGAGQAGEVGAKPEGGVLLGWGWDAACPGMGRGVQSRGGVCDRNGSLVLVKEIDQIK